MMKKVLFAVLCMVVAFQVFQVQRSRAAIKEDPTQIIYLISIPGLSFQEITPSLSTSYPQLYNVIKGAGIGALNIRTPYKGIEDIYLSIGGGLPASALETFNGMHHNEMKLGETAASLYLRYTGEMAEGSEIMIPEINAIKEMNRKSDYGANPGLLGDVLEHAGVAVAVFGNRDREEIKRSAPLLLMNGKGRVAKGAIDDRVLESNKERPYSVKTNYSMILEQLHMLKESSWILGDQVVLIELGDLDRLYADKTAYNNEVFLQLKSQIMGEIDAFIGGVATHMAAADSLWMFSPQVHQDALRDKSMLAPIIWYKHGKSHALISSNTTRRPGVAASIDIAPSILFELGITIPKEFLGNPVFNNNNPNSFAFLYEEVMAMERVYQLRPQILYSYVIYEMLVLLISLLFAIRVGLRNRRWLIIPLVSTLLAPLIMLPIHWFSDFPNLFVIIMFYVTILGLSWVCYLFPILKSIGFLSFIIMLVILLDGTLGAEMMKRSILGYDPMVGARYYGIGNEYMGILIGATILAISIGAHYLNGLYPKLTLIGISLICVYIIFYLASPSLGTNAGGAITACISLGIFWVRMFGGDRLQEIRWFRLISIMFIFGGVSLLGLWVLNHVIGSNVEQQSHIGKAMGQLSEGQFDILGNILMRKLTMNWHLIGVSSWSKVFITSLFVMAVILLKPRGVFRKWQNTMPYIMYGLSANAIGAIIVLIVNDSGIVAAATLIIYVAVPVLILKLQDNRESHSS